MMFSTTSTFNFSNSTLLKSFGRVKTTSATETSIMTMFLVLLIILTLFGNGLVLGIFYQYKPLRTVTNYFIVSLAVADMLVAVLSIPIWIAYIHVGLAENKFGEVVSENNKIKIFPCYGRLHEGEYVQ